NERKISLEFNPNSRQRSVGPSPEQSPSNGKVSAPSMDIMQATNHLQTGWERVRTLALFDTKIIALKRRIDALARFEKTAQKDFAEECKMSDAMILVQEFLNTPHGLVPEPISCEGVADDLQLLGTLREIRRVNNYVINYLPKLKAEFVQLTRTSM